MRPSNALVEADWDDRVARCEGGFSYRPSEHGIVAMRVVSRILQRMGATPRGEAVGTLVARLRAGEPSSLGGVLARAEGGAWVFRPEPPRKTS